MKIAIVPGSFDPITLGHVNIIERAAKMFDSVCVAVMVNDSSKYSSELSSKSYMLDMEARLETVRLSVSHIPNAEAIASRGMLIDLFDELGAAAVVRGVRDENDLAYEKVHAEWNRAHNPRFEAVFLLADPTLSGVSSTRVRELIAARDFAALEGLVPAEAIKYLEKNT